MVRYYFDEIGDCGRAVTIFLGEETLVVVSHDFSVVAVRAPNDLRSDLSYCSLYLYHFLIEQYEPSCFVGANQILFDPKCPSLVFKKFR